MDQVVNISWKRKLRKNLINSILIINSSQPKTKKKIQGRKKSKDEDQEMDLDDGNKEDEEALAAGRESDVYERMVMDEVYPGI
jgi:hypothetical protein